MSKWLFIARLTLFVGAFNFLEHFAHQKTDGFTLQRIQFEECVTPQTPHAYHPALDQNYHYLRCGNQCYAFLSEDGHYVLKFFKYAQPLTPRFLSKIPLLNYFKPFRLHRLEKQLWKRNRDFHGYHLAFQMFREEAALLDLHLTPENNHYPTIQITDKLHCLHTLDLNQTPFILQRKASPIYPQLLQWKAQGNIETAQHALQSLLQLLKHRIALGIQDDDVHFYSNFGFIGAQAIQLDPGHFKQGPIENPHHELQTVTRELRTWCAENIPILLETLEHDE